MFSLAHPLLSHRYHQLHDKSHDPSCKQVTGAKSRLHFVNKVFILRAKDQRSKILQSYTLLQCPLPRHFECIKSTDSFSRSFLFSNRSILISILAPRAIKQGMTRIYKDLILNCKLLFRRKLNEKMFYSFSQFFFFFPISFRIWADMNFNADL